MEDLVYLGCKLMEYNFIKIKVLKEKVFQISLNNPKSRNAINSIMLDELIDCLKIANAWEFVNKLPDGIDNNIGDSGNKLSGGQKQRLSIARAVLKNPPILVLDEATSALDSESEKLVQNALDNLMKNKTSIVIAHRLSTIQNADSIIVLDKGKIVESGVHKDLMKKDGIYSNLVKMQSI